MTLPLDEELARLKKPRTHCSNCAQPVKPFQSDRNRFYHTDSGSQWCTEVGGARAEA